MQYVLRDRRLVPPRPSGQALGWRITSATAGCAGAAIAVGLLVLRRNVPELVLLSAALLVLGTIALLHGRFLQFFRGRLLLTSASLENQEQEFRSIFNGALDAFLVLDDEMICWDANPAAHLFFAVDHEQLLGRPISVFGSDPCELYATWKRVQVAGQGRGQVEMLRADGSRAAAEFTLTFNMLPGRHLLVLHDATQRLQAEEVKTQSLIVTKAALQEATALRNATLALTQSLHLNPVLDSLLVTLRSLIPCQTAQVLLLETPTRLFLAREVSGESGTPPLWPEIIDPTTIPALQQALAQREGMLLGDTQIETAWTEFARTCRARSWIGVPMCVRNQVIGLLSLMHSDPVQFTAEHRRLATCLAVPAALAIENARLRERAEICGTELEKRLADIRHMEQALAIREESGHGLN
jgi:PAS domain-containing protein